MFTITTYDLDGNRVDEAEAETEAAASLAAATLFADYEDAGGNPRDLTVRFEEGVAEVILGALAPRVAA